MGPQVVDISGLITVNVNLNSTLLEATIDRRITMRQRRGNP
jgi:hypothetical protein